VHFFIGDNEYVYILDYNDKHIRREELKKNNELVFSISKDLDNQEKNRYILEFENITAKEYDIAALSKVFKVGCCEGKYQIK
jgi:hypothetical protein